MGWAALRLPLLALLVAPATQHRPPPKFPPQLPTATVQASVASTLRDAHLRGIHTVLLSDGCAAFSQKVHDATLVSLGSVTDVMTCAEAVEKIAAA